MMDFETEEQQVEALKKWWKENARSIIAGVIVGVSVLGGWRYYHQYQVNHAEHASMIYEKVLIDSNNANLIEEQQTDVNKLLAEYSDTPYASLAALVLAKTQFNKGEVQKAQQNLEWVMSHSKQTELKYLARLRMMRILTAMNQYDEALQLANVDYPSSFTVMFEELKGDIYVLTKQYNEARQAYDKAILASSQQPARWLRLKRDDLGNMKLDEPSA